MIDMEIDFEKKEIIVKSEFKDYPDEVEYEGSTLIKCGVIFIRSDSIFFMNCSFESCLKTTFYDTNAFENHIRDYHKNLVSNDILENISETTKVTEFEELSPTGICTVSKKKLRREPERKTDENKSFECIQTNPLEIKLKVLPDKKELTCHICNKLFSKIVYLKRHLKRHLKNPKSLVEYKKHDAKIKCEPHLQSATEVSKSRKANRSTPLITEPVVEITNEIENSDIKIFSENIYNLVPQIILNSVPEEDIKSNILDIDSYKITDTTELALGEQITKNDISENSLNLKSKENGCLTRTCHICHKTFQTRKYLRRHIIRHNNKNQNNQKGNIRPVKIIPCPKCNKIFKYDHHLRFHMVVHEVEHKCPECDKILPNRSTLQRHIVRHFDEKPFECELCNSKFSLKENLLKHEKRIHQEKVFECNVCNQSFPNQNVLNSHRLSSHRIAISEEVLEKPKVPIIHKCEACSKTFKTKKTLKRHFLTHRSKTPIPCPKCTRTFKFEHNFKSHIEMHERIHQCPDCNKIYANRKALANHLPFHSGEKQFKCENCDTWSFTKAQLKRHILVAHTEKKHECEYCGKKFSKRHALITHTRTHTKEKPLVCEICGMSFFTQFLLNGHLKRHNNQRDFKCTFEGCDKTFFTKVAQKDHEVTHTKLKSYFCTYEGCNSRFTLRSGLMKHKKLHSSVKSYICKICGKAYAQGPGLYAHMKTHAQPGPTV